MKLLKVETIEIKGPFDIVKARQRVRALAQELGFSLVDQTKLVTASSELARNTDEHGGGGIVNIEVIDDRNKLGIRMTFIDEGPGIIDIDLALSDGYSTGNGLGLGLSGSRRLVNEFEITSEPGHGTTVMATRWR
jgi:serine/threonine-protein kinase RsbT